MATINLHSGLSPYYRGTWSYGWPIVNNEPEYIGATVHHVDPGIDTGDVIYQTRPVLDETDDLNTIFLKVVAEGIELVADAIEGMTARGGVESWRQPKEAGRLYLSRDPNGDAARLCLSRLEAGLIKKYNENKQSADARVILRGYKPPRFFR
jgi:methionyl-tRNA formyltransferase